MEAEIKEMLESYKRMSRELDETGGPAENGELFETVIEMEEDILRALELPPAQKYREMLWGNDVQQIVDSLEMERIKYGDRPIVDPMLLLVDAVLKKKDDPYNLLPMAGFSVHMYQLFMFSEKMLGSSGPREMDDIMAEMRLAEEYLGDLGKVGIEGIRNNPELYRKLLDAGFESLDEYLIHNEKFDMDEKEMDARQFYLRGKHHLAKERFDDAIADFSNSLWLNPGDPEVLCNRGHAFKMVEEYHRAVEDYSFAIFRDPEHYDALCERGGIFGTKGLHDDAMEDFSRAVSLRPDCGKAYHGRGILYSIVEDIEKAIEDFNTAHILDPGNAIILCNRGYAYLRLGRIKMALEDIKKSAGMGFDGAEWLLKNCFGADSNEGC
jgi:regulator of sirC expression with transglutaminase-like and TPR domain